MPVINASRNALSYSSRHIDAFIRSTIMFNSLSVIGHWRTVRFGPATVEQALRESQTSYMVAIGSSEINV